MTMNDTPRIRAIAFDLDGLMFDTEALFFRVAGEMLADRGKQFTHEIMAAMIGRNWAVSGAAFKQMAELHETTDELLDEARARFLPRMDLEARPMPGLLALLDHVEGIALPKAVTTSSRRDYAFRLLDAHALTPRFHFVLGSEDVARHKPDPEIYRTAAARFGVPTESLLVLEDTPTGVAAAHAAGAFVVAVPHEFSPGDNLGAAHRVIPRLDHPDLIRLIAG